MIGMFITGLVAGVCFAGSALCMFDRAMGEARRANKAYAYFVSEVDRLVSWEDASDEDWQALIGRYLGLLDYVFVPADDETEVDEG